MPDTTDHTGTYVAKNRFFFGSHRGHVEPGGHVTLTHEEAALALAQGTIHPGKIVSQVATESVPESTSAPEADETPVATTSVAPTSGGASGRRNR